MENMTVKDFYEWAVSHNAENLSIRIQHRDECRSYEIYDWLYKEDIEIDFLRATVTL